MFTKLLIGQAVNSDKVNSYLLSKPEWKEFETKVYNVRMEEDSKKLGSATEKKVEEDVDEDLNARDENFNSDELFDKGEDKEKFNIYPGDGEEEEDKDSKEEEFSSKNKITFEEVTEEIINPNVQPEEEVIKPKIFLQDMKDPGIEPELIIGKFYNEFAENNYWKESPSTNIASVEADYEC